MIDLDCWESLEGVGFELEHEFNGRESVVRME